MTQDQQFILEADPAAPCAGKSATGAGTSAATSTVGRSSGDSPACDGTQRGAACADVCTVPAPLLERLLTLLTPRPFRKRHPLLFWGGLALLALCLVGGVAAWLTGRDAIAVVRVEGMIADTRPLLRWVEKIRTNTNVKGVLLRIDSPGGGAAASQELYDALCKLNLTKPVAASLGSVAASGGLMAALAARYVVANPSTVTGSIGVRMDIPQVQGLLEKIGVNKETLTTGRFKDAGSPTRPLTPEERAYFSRVLEDMHEQFVLLVAEGRHLPLDTVRGLADGRIMTGREALEHKLVDALGGQDVALAYLRKELQLPADSPVLEAPQPSSLMRDMLQNVLGIDLPHSQSPAFLYLF